MSDFKRIGRNNKNRGRKFERDVAAQLGWTRVPYSGGQGDWGKGDVVDGFYTGNGYWVAECKTQIAKDDQPLSISVKHKWVDQMMTAETKNRRGVIIVRRVRNSQLRPGKKGPTPYVVMLEDTFVWMRNQILERANRFGTEGPRLESMAWEPDIKTRGKGYNFTVKEGDLPYADEIRSVHVMKDGERSSWYILTLDHFAELVRGYGLMKFEQAPNDD